MSAHRSSPRLNGSYQVFSYSGGIAVVLAPRVLVAPNFGTVFGYVQPAVYAFQPYQAYTVDNLTHRKGGAPLCRQLDAADPNTRVGPLWMCRRHDRA